jgi:hypothetical protein
MEKLRLDELIGERGISLFASSVIASSQCYPEKLCFLNKIFAAKEHKEHIDKSLYF